ncbi:hypothetical protein KCP76_15360 [Salmonella enterica subsp. enterica serovar Weltevreden]|nr:hypothetical protein KCP76_15360 [Salmonella enterica subsp. enterica serovar Weltevreden]
MRYQGTVVMLPAGRAVLCGGTGRITGAGITVWLGSVGFGAGLYMADVSYP